MTVPKRGLRHRWRPWAIIESPDGTFKLMQFCDNCKATRTVQARKLGAWTHNSKPSREIARCFKTPVEDEIADNCIDATLK